MSKKSSPILNDPNYRNELNDKYLSLNKSKKKLINQIVIKTLEECNLSNHKKKFEIKASLNEISWNLIDLNIQKGFASRSKNSNYKESVNLIKLFSKTEKHINKLLIEIKKSKWVALPVKFHLETALQEIEQSKMEYATQWSFIKNRSKNLSIAYHSMSKNFKKKSDANYLVNRLIINLKNEFDLESNVSSWYDRVRKHDITHN